MQIRLNLRQKAYLYILVGLLSTSMLLYMGVRFFLEQHARQVEVVQCEQNVTRVQKSLLALLDQVDVFAGDWAAWDDSYDYIDSGAQAYVDSNVVVESFSNGELNFMGYVNTAGDFRLMRQVDRQRESFVPVDKELEEYLHSKPQIWRHASPDDRHKGLIRLAQGIMILVSRPILKSDRSGPVRGAFIVGAWLDAERRAQIKDITLSDFALYPWQGVSDSQGVSLARRHLKKMGEIYIEEQSPETLHAYTIIEDILGDSLLMLEVDTPRVLMQEARRTTNYFVLAFTGIWLIIGFLVAMLLRLQILRRLFLLERTARLVGQERDFSQRIPDMGEDELGSLAESINGMLAALRQSEEALRENESYLESVLGAIHTGVMVVDPETHTIVDVNTSACDMIGLAKEAITGEICHGFVCPAQCGACPVTDLKQAVDYSERVLLTVNSTRVPILKSCIPVQRAGKTLLVESFVDISDLKSAQAALERSEEHYRSIIENVSDIITILDFSGTILYNSPSLEQVLGYASDELLSKDIYSFVHPEDSMLLKENLEDVFRAPVMGTAVQFRFRDKHNSWRILECSARSTSDEKGSHQVVAISRDITARVAAEKALQESEERYRTLIRNLPIGLFRSTLDEQGYFLMANPALAQIFGYDDLDEFLKLKPAQLYPNIKERKSLARAVQEHGSVKNYEVRMLRKGGRRFWVAITASLCQGAEEGHFLLDGMVQDISERKHAEEALRTSEERFRSLSENSLDSIMRFDRDLRHIYVNPASTVFTGMAMEELLGKTHREMNFPADLVTLWEQTLERTFKEGSPQRVSFKLPNGVWLDWSLFPEKNSEGMVEAVSTAARDISEQKATEEALQEAKESAEEANRLKTSFLTTMSHEIRTPLNGIIGFAELVSEADSPVAMREWAKSILQQSQILLSLINDLLDQAKIMAGKLSLEERPFSLDQLLEQQVSNFNMQLSQKGLDFILQKDPKTAVGLVGDELRLGQVLRNLLSNALKFTEEGSITLAVTPFEDKEKKPCLYFAVSDTGIGIPEDKQNAIFQSFTQADGSTTRKYGGTGLGTTISRDLVDLMGGEIGLESTPGAGSTFWFTIPAIPCAPELLTNEREEEKLAQRHNHPCTLLLAEDYPPNQQVARLHLENAGHSVLIVDNGRLAVQAAQEKSYDAILMDIQMPVMDGFEAAKQIRAGNSCNAQVPIIAMTAFADRQTRQKCLELGMSDVITKPLRRQALLRKVQRWTRPEAFEEEGDETLGADLAQVQQDRQQETPQLSSPIRFEKTVEEFGGDRALVLEVLDQFILEFEAQFVMMESALKQEDFEILRREAHKIKGAALNLCAEPLAQAALKVEEMVDREDRNEAQGLLLALEEAFQDFQAYRMTLRS